MEPMYMKCPKCKTRFVAQKAQKIDDENEIGMKTYCIKCGAHMPIVIRRGDVYISNLYLTRNDQAFWAVDDHILVGALAGHCQLLHGYL